MNLAKVFRYYADKHVDDKKSNDDNVSDEVQRSPFVVVADGLEIVKDKLLS